MAMFSVPCPAMLNDHPPAFGHQHPWLDPLEPQDPFNPRPDTELAMAGGLAPDPQAFPFTPDGQAEYYRAVKSAAHQMQMDQMMWTQAIYGEDEEVAVAARAAAHRRTCFLLLCP